MKTFITHISLLTVFMFFSAIAFAHNGSLKGMIYDGNTQKPVEGVSIYIKELKISSVTDAFGKFFLKEIPVGTYTITLDRIGFEKLEDKLKVEDGVTTDLSFKMEHSSIKIEAVTINAKSDLTLGTISDVDIKQRPVNTSQDLLRMVPGLFIAQHQGGGKAEQMFLRGFDIDHGTDVNVSVDGMPVNMVSHAHGQGYADLHFLIPETVDKMNFGKGPYQADKGNMATAGFVEFNTKKHLDNSFVKLEGGTYGYFRSVAAIDLLGKTNIKNQEAYVAGEYSYNRSYFDVPQNFNRVNVMGKYTNYLSKDKMLSFTASAFRSNWHASGQVPERAVERGDIGRFGELSPEEGATSRYNANLQYSQAINNHSSFKSNLFLSYYDFELYSNFTFFLEDTINGDQIRQKEKRVITGYNGSYSSTYDIAGLKTKTDIGVGFRYDNVMDNELSHTVNFNTTLNRLALGDINETNLFAYANQAFYLSPQLVFNAGLRYDYFIHSYTDKIPLEAQKSTANTGALSPKAGLYYNFADNARVYFNYGVGFHSNDTRVVVPQDGIGVLPLAFSYDLGTVVKPFERLLLSAGVFLLDLQQEFVYVGDGAVVEPSGRSRRIGADLSARYDVTKWLYVDADINYTHARARDEAAGEDFIPLAARLTSIGGLTIKPFKSLSAGIRYRHMGDRPANEDNTVIAEGYTVCDLIVNYSRPKYEFGVQVQNLFNVEWNEAQFDTETRLRYETASVSEICFTPGTPFFIKLTAAYKF
jgi:outer membrane receptor protein involved in Fe transport